MRKILLGIILFSLFFPGLPGYAQSDEGYGEDQDALGQFVDSFETSGNVSVTVNVIRNATLELMELNFTIIGSVGNYENFTTYTETDPQNKMTVYDYNVTWIDYDRDDGGRVVYDYGAGNIKDGFEYTFEVNLTALEAGDADSRNFQNLIVMSYTDQAARTNNEIQIILRQRGADDTIYGINFYQYDNAGNDINAGVIDYNVSQIYYYLVNRTGTSKDLIIFYDSARTSVAEKLNVGIGNDNYRYLAVSKVAASAVDGADDSDGYIRNLWNTSKTGGGPIWGYSDEGYFTTVDYLSDPLANGSALVSMVNTSIPANTQILMQFSNDNTTWEDNEGVPLDSHVLSGGFESFDLRELNYSTGYWSRFNLSTTDSSITPRVYQNRVITTIGNATVGGGGGPGVVNRPTILIVGGLITIVIAVFIGVKKR